jgi:hypothetical protein
MELVVPRPALRDQKAVNVLCLLNVCGYARTGDRRVLSPLNTLQLLLRKSNVMLEQLKLCSAANL